ncbi:B12-binding domain-containing radical SAM protein [Candidatus Palauibacter soopunensis]|uniref:B12-binding domain-containing radical SAM protein n=1 Tax=Candidatus Palauibacter soopunensis TaxID=3056739 RepID=UPI0023848196|nr:B12-binding domain-containing radical SAM protein [Candidatus Palauibacter soopunensis]MDE2878116.1 B12-binding domain-containing radical SAM protein [Candidatus Palauibacter soopunensis]
MPNALLLHPRHPPTYWGHNYALEILGIRAAFPPLGLLTVAAMFPPRYNLRVVDLNVTALENADLEWADLAFTSSMIPQRPSLERVVERCNRAQVPVIAGGPHPTTFHEEMEGVDHFVLDEVEETFPGFLRDLENGAAKAIYRAPRKPAVTLAPLPRFDLIDMNDYYSMCLQFSRGCPFDCEFCDITKLYGRVSRTKSPEQMVAEFDHLYELGWRGPLFLVDDNFIGNKREALRLLPAIAEWQKDRNHPYSLFTEATVNLVRMDDLMDLMIEAGFDAVFLGIETPNPKALKKMKKPQNIDMRDDNYLFKAVRSIQGKGMQVLGGFILGLDEDDENAFDAQIDFIQEAGIPMALIGLLTALKGTDLWARLERENRLLDKPVEIDDTSLNFKPQMDPGTLVEGYLRVIGTIYDSTLENYFDRCLTLLDHLGPVPHLHKPVSAHVLYAGIMGIRRRLTPEQLPPFSRYIAKVSKDHPQFLPLAISLAATGHHCEKFTRQQTVLRGFKEYLKSELASFHEAGSDAGSASGSEDDYRREALQRAEARRNAIPREFRFAGDGIREALAAFELALSSGPRPPAPEDAGLPVLGATGRASRAEAM